jgi:hypothetical protein
MIIDKKLMLSTGTAGAAGPGGGTATSVGQAITASAQTTDILDCLVDIGGVSDLYMVFTNIGGATVATATSIAFEIQSCATAGGTYVTAAKSAAIPVASLVAGYQVILPLPPGLSKYVAGYYTVAGSNATSATFSCVIVDGIQRNVAMPDAVSQLA